MSLYRPTIVRDGKKSKSRIFWMDFHFTGQRIRESTGMSSITRAREVEDKRKQELRDGAAGIRKRETPKLFSVAAADWIEVKKHKWSASMLSIAESSLKHLAPMFAKKLVVDIEARDISRYQKVRSEEGASGRTTNIEVGCLRAVLKRAGVWARIQPDVEMLKERDDAGHALSNDEETILLEECGKSRSRVLRPFVTLAIETAARYGTIRRLQWRNVDFANRCLQFGKDKTRAGSDRKIPLMPRALEILKFWSQSFPDREPDHFVFPHERYGASGTDDVFGFTESTVYETDPSRPTGGIKKAWEAARSRTRRHCAKCKTGRLAETDAGYACSSCGSETDELPRGLVGVRLHDLRHTGVSRMINARIPLPIIAKIVGWSAGTLAKMAARYGHFSIEEMRSAMDLVTRPEGIPAEYPNKSPNANDCKTGRIQ